MHIKLRSTKVNFSIKLSFLLCSIFNVAHSIEPASINLENGISVKPILNVISKYDDNIYQQSVNKQGDTILKVSPSIDVLIDDGLNQYKLDIDLNSGIYSKNSDDNYLDSNVDFSAHFELSQRHRFDVLTSVSSQTEPRGTGVTEGVGSALPEPLTFKDDSIGGKYEFGALSSVARISFEAKAESKKYDNFRNVSKYRDNSSTKLGSSLFYKMDSATDLFVVVSRDDIKYDHIEDNSTSRDSIDNKISLGVQWGMTSVTTGIVKLGYQKKSFGDDLRENFSGLSWEAEVEWQPLTYTSIAFETSRSAKDPTAQGDYVNQSVYGATWKHKWNQKLSSSLGVSFSKDIYTGIDREDEIVMASVSFSYLIQRWLEAGVFIDIKDNESTSEVMSFDKNLIGLNFNISM